MGFHIANGGPLRQRGFAHDSPNSARARVRRGIKALNAHFGNTLWRKKINLVTLDVSDLNLCPLGQVFGWYGAAPFELRAGGLNKALGFERSINEEGGVDYEALNRAWKSELRQR